MASLGGLDGNLVVTAMSSVFGGGLILGLLKLRPQRDSIVVEASKNAVELVNGAIDGMRAEVNQSAIEIAKLRAQTAHVAEDLVVWREKYSTLYEEHILLKSDYILLKSKYEALLIEVDGMRRQIREGTQ